jgi:hypothetical protein
MLDFIYNAMWQSYTQEEAKILYTDTDSLYVQIRKCPDINTYKDFQQRFPPRLQQLHFAEAGDLTVGKMKLEKVIEEAVFLKPKTYALLSKQGQQEPHNKGVKIYQNHQQHLLEKYKQVLFQRQVVKCANVNIRRTEKFGGLRMNTLRQSKIGLDYWEDKRFWINMLTSSPYGLLAPNQALRPVLQRIMNNLHSRALLLYPDLTREEFITVFGQEGQLFLPILEVQFEVGMCWRNYGRSWELDHIIPVSFVRKADYQALTEQQQRKVRAKIVHHTNIQPMLSDLNSAKNDKMTPKAQAMLQATLE